MPALAAAGAFGAVMASMLVWYAPSFERRFGLPVVDLAGLTTPAERMELIAAYGDAGREAYLTFLAIDCVFPICAGLFVFTTLRALLVWQQLDRPWTRLMLWWPAVGPLADLTENAFHALLTLSFPNMASGIAQSAYIASSVKYLGVSVSQVLLVLFLLRGAAVQLTRRTEQPSEARSIDT